MATLGKRDPSNTQLSVARLLCVVAAVGLGLLTLYCLLWLVSSSSMAFAECNGHYGLFSSNARCRQPPFVGLLAVASCVFALVLAWLGAWLGKRHRHNGA